jgi:hypothetical protein
MEFEGIGVVGACFAVPWVAGRSKSIETGVGVLWWRQYQRHILGFGPEKQGSNRVSSAKAR